MTKIGFSYWGFCEKPEDSTVVDTPDGGRFTRQIFVKELLKRGYEVIALQKQRETKPLSGLQFDQGYPKIDALFIEWRWSTWKNDPSHPNHNPNSFEPDLLRQKRLLEHYHDIEQIPIVIWDTDLKMTKADKERWKDAVICEPCLKSSEGTYSLPYFTDGSELPVNVYDTKTNTYVYIGSNYERYEQFERYYAELAKTLKDNYNVNTHVFGNWLKKSPERPEQDKKVQIYSDMGVQFHPRNKFLEGMDVLSRSLLTIHITKHQYSQKGLITPRYFEAMAVGTPGLMPEEMYNEIGADFGLGVANQNKILQYIEAFKKDHEFCFKFAHKQKQDMLSYPWFNVTWTVDRLEDLFEIAGGW